MRLTCPKCQTQYEVSASAIPSEGREVQCGSCQETWFQLPQVSNTPEAQDRSDAPAKQDAAQAAPRPDQAAQAPVSSPKDPIPEKPQFETDDTQITQDASDGPDENPTDGQKIAAALTSVSAAGIAPLTTRFASNTDQSAPVVEEIKTTLKAPLNGKDIDKDGDKDIAEAVADQSDAETLVSETLGGDAVESALDGVDQDIPDAFSANGTKADENADAINDDQSDFTDTDLTSLDFTRPMPEVPDAPQDTTASAAPENDLKNGKDTSAAVASAMAALGVTEPKAIVAQTVDAETDATAELSLGDAAETAQESITNSIAGMAEEMGEKTGVADADASQIDAINKRIEEGVAELAKSSKESAQEALGEDDRPIFDGEGNLDVGVFEPDDVSQPVAPDETVDAIRNSLASAQSGKEGVSGAIDATEVFESDATDDLVQDLGSGLDTQLDDELSPDEAVEVAEDLSDDLSEAPDSAPENTIDAIRAALAEDDADLPISQDATPEQAPDLPKDEKNIGARIAAAGAATAAAAAVVSMPKPEAGDATNGNNLAERLKARVAEAALERDKAGVARSPDADGRYLAATPDTVEAVRAAIAEEDDIADGSIPRNERRVASRNDNLGSRLQTTVAPEPTRSRFTTGVYTALLLFVIGLLLYLFAPQISANVPQAEPILTSYTSSIDGLRASIAGLFNQGS